MMMMMMMMMMLWFWFWFWFCLKHVTTWWCHGIDRHLWFSLYSPLEMIYDSHDYQPEIITLSRFIWLVVSSHPKNISQLGGLSSIYGKNKTCSSHHQPVHHGFTARNSPCPARFCTILRSRFCMCDMPHAQPFIIAWAFRTSGPQFGIAKLVDLSIIFHQIP